MPNAIYYADIFRGNSSPLLGNPGSLGKQQSAREITNNFVNSKFRQIVTGKYVNRQTSRPAYYELRVIFNDFGDLCHPLYGDTGLAR